MERFSTSRSLKNKKDMKFETFSHSYFNGCALYEFLCRSYRKEIGKKHNKIVSIKFLTEIALQKTLKANFSAKMF